MGLNTYTDGKYVLEFSVINRGKLLATWSSTPLEIVEVYYALYGEFELWCGAYENVYDAPVSMRAVGEKTLAHALYMASV